MQTRSGMAFDFLSPQPAHVQIGDVAHALARINRFSGHALVEYSVAQHSLLVVELLRGYGVTSPAVLLQGLVHDAPEAYLGDVVAPLKALVPEYQAIERRVWEVCALVLGADVQLHPEVRLADREACCLEAHQLYPTRPVEDWAGPDERSSLSVAAHEVLCGEDSPNGWTLRWMEAFCDLHAARQRGLL